MTPSVDRDQLAVLRRLQAAFGDVQVLAVERREVGEGDGKRCPSPASQQLPLTIQTPPPTPSPHRRAGLPDPSTR
jgi:hypothetical protein